MYPEVNFHANSRMSRDETYRPYRGKDQSRCERVERDEMIREIDSNPLSDISWYDGAELLKNRPRWQ